MKKIMTILLTICLASMLASCASQGDLDAIMAERDALQAKYDALQAEYEVLQEPEALYPDVLALIDAESYTEAIQLVKRLQRGKAFLEKGPIEDYLVTVELTAENFDDYFEWISFPSLDAFGAEDGYTTFVLTSKVYQDGLVFYRSDAKYILENDAYENTLDVGSPIIWSNDYLPDSMKVASVSGSVTFVKSDYVMEYSVEKADPTFHPQNPADPFLGATVTLVNGESFYRSIIPGYEY